MIGNRPHGTRAEFLKLAAVMRDQAAALRAFHMPHMLPTDQNVLLAVHFWAYYGAQSVLMPDTYAAALMCTDAKEALKGQRLPWPAFEIRVPPKLLESSTGEVDAVYVIDIPSEMPRTGNYAHHNLSLAYHDANSWGINTFPDLASMFDAEESERSGRRELEGCLPESIEAMYNEDHERRLWSMIARLVGGVVLAIAGARAERSDAFPAREARVKHEALKPNTVQLGRSLKIDCRGNVRDFVKGVGRAHGPQTIQTLVRGHWKQQAYGPKWSLHRPQWIEPFFRGPDGPLLSRPTKLGFGKEAP